jgi:hypothetical protein
MTMNEYLKKYPWLSGYDPYPECSDEEHYCVLEDMPRGWLAAFGEMFCEDLDKAIKSAGLEGIFRIDQLKEKYASLRVYYHPNSPEIDNVIRRYESISEHVCEFCGAPDVPVVNMAMVAACCRTCYNRMQVGCDPTAYDRAASRDFRIPEKISWRRYTTDKTETFELDISETVSKVREGWKNRVLNGTAIIFDWEDE